MSDENHKSDGAPSHLFLIEARAKGYQLYVERLKKGGKSGISEMFGSAEELFAEKVEAQPVELLDLSQLTPPDSSELERRAIAFAESVRQVSGDFQSTSGGVRMESWARRSKSRLRSLNRKTHSPPQLRI